MEEWWMKKKKQYNCFKFVGMLFCMLVCILLFPKETFAEESNYITVTYAKNINSGFLYSDDMMLTNANDLSTDIAKMAMGLANVAYSEKAVKQCLSDMEYSLLGGDTYNYTKNTYTYTNNDYVDYSIGYKQYKGYNIYLVVIKGTGTNYDWFSNFNLGKGDYHQGFKLAADGVLNTINNKVKTSNNIFLVTGHSRGAAVANIVAAELTADGSLASSDHIFGYTYACPAVKIGADTSYKNIRNYNNPGDAVPELPLEAWGYERYGETINLSTQSDIYQNFKQRFKSVEGENYAGVVNTDSFVSTLLALADTRDAYYNPDNHLWFDFFAYLLGPASKESIDWSVVAQIIKDNDITGATASCLIHILQDAVSTGITALSKVENSEGSWKSEFMSRIDSALLETKDYTDEEFKTWLTSKPYVVAEIRKEFHIEVETRQSLVAAQRTLESELDNYSPMLANGETLLYLFFSTDFKPVSAISHGHQPSSYVLWINSMYYGYEGWKGNTEITNVDLNGIDTIGENCFCNCSKLSRINGMNSITAFGNSAFYNLSKLKVVGKFAAQVKYIGNYAFSGCSNMTGEIKQISEYIGTSAFSGCSGITGKIILSGKLGKVSEKAFSNTGIKEVEMQDGIEIIGDEAFAECKELEKVKIADSVGTLGKRAFEYCSSLKEIHLPVSAKYDTYVNGGSTTSATFVDVQAEKIVFTKGTGEVFVPETDEDWHHSNISLPWYSKDSLKEVEFEEGIEKIYAEALSGCWKVETIKIPETVKKIGDRAFANCTSWTGEVYLPPKLESIGISAFSGCCKQIGKIILLGNLRMISDSAFSNTGIEEVEVQDGIESIGENAFANCKKLGRVTIADSVMTIGRSAFEYCSSLKEITLPISAKYDTYVNGGSTTSATFVDVQAEKIVFTKGTGEVFVPETDKDWYHSNISLPWYSKDSLKEVEFEEGIEKIYAEALSGCWKVETIKIPETVKKIGDRAFANCISWTGKMYLPPKLESIGASAFSGCGKQTGKVNLLGNLKTVSESAFANTGIEEVTVQDGIESIGEDAFASCKKLKRVIIADSVMTIGRSAFEYCSSLKEITLPISAKYDTYVNGGSTTSATFVDVQAEKIVFTKGTGEVFVPETDKDWYHSNISLPWYSKDSLKEVEFEEGIEKIYAEALSGCWKVETIKIPETVKKIGDRAFANCTSWAGELYLPKGLKSIGEGAFFNCSRLTNILVPALQTELNTNCFDSNITTVLWGLNNSTTETYAAANNITFKAINYPYLTYDNIKVLTPGQNYRFIATVFTDINESTDKVTWAIAGSVSDDTIIDASGLLSVAANESAKELTVSANYGGEISSMKFAVEMDEHEHTYEYQITKDATCTEVGIATYTCSLCGDSYMEEIPALGHDYGEWKTVKEATYTEEGLEEQICSRDPSHKQTRSIPKRKIPFSLVELQLSDTVYVYDGKEKKPTVTITYNGKVLAEGVDYSIRYSDNVNPGTATITVEAKENSSYIGSIQKKFVIRPAMEDNTVVVQPNAFEGCSNIINLNIRATVTEIGTQAFADCKNLNSIYFYGNCPKIGENIFRNVKATAYYPCNDMSWTIDRLQDYGGKITWCPWNPATGKPAKRSLSICELSVNVGTQLYDGKVKTPQVAVKDGNKVLQANVDYVVSYQNNVNPGTGTITVSGTGSYGGTLTARFTIQKGNNVISVSEITKNYSAKTQKAKTNARAYGGAGLTYASNSKSVKIDKYGRIKITKKFVGRAVITVRASETPNYRAASRQFTVTVRPSATSISKASNSAKKKMTVSWKKNKTCSGYALQYSTDKKFKKGVKTVYISKNSRTKTTVSRLAKGKTYYVRLASYKKAGNTKILSKWSKVKKVKIRK